MKLMASPCSTAGCTKGDLAFLCLASGWLDTLEHDRSAIDASGLNLHRSEKRLVIHICPLGINSGIGGGRFLVHFYFFKNTPDFIHQKTVGPVETLHRQIKQLVCLLLFSPCCMKKSARHNYKALYQQCSQQSADKTG